jgi:GH25 family lysozyme M1 (1,4-beta-N-acetylmuramidase)/glucan-binding YG repeat protein
MDGRAGHARTMRNKIIFLVIAAAVAVVCAFGLRHYNGYWFFFDMPDRAGWVTDGAGLKYRDRHASIVTDTLLEIDAEKYYFGTDGSVRKGEAELDGYVYLFDEQTGKMRYGWAWRGEGRCYFDEGGRKIIDREYTIGGRDFLFGATGAEYTGPIRIDGKDYYFEELVGKIKDGEKQVDGNWYYYTGDGSRFGTGWATLPDGRICYYDGDAGMLFGEQTIGGQPYLLNISMGGRMAGTVYYGGEVYSIGEDGVVAGKEKTPIWKGIDVSWHQGPDIDWKAVAESGVQFAVVRAAYIAAEDTPHFVPDEYFARNAIEAQKNGISVGAYIYLYNFTEEGLAEGIDAFDALLKENRVCLDLPVFLDVENDEYFKTGSDALGGYDYRTDLARYGMDRLRSLGYGAGFYTFQNWANKEFDAERLYGEGYPFWLARWYGNDADPDPETMAWNDTRRPSLWQFRATGQIPGIGTETDVNYLYWDRMP